MVATLRRHLSAIPSQAWLLALVFACLAGFAGKAVHIDDPLFIRAAQQIQKHPADFYGFRMNWWGETAPMILDTDNPPLASYYMALAAALAGWSEPALHLAFLLPALAAAWGVFSLARYHCGQPLLAAGAAVLTPVFLISATTLMCDVTLLAFWVWSVVLFEKGLHDNDPLALAGSGLLAGLAYCAKFSGLAIVPLLAVYGLCRQRRLGWWVIAPLLPLLFVAGYEAITWRLYGRGPLLGAAIGTVSRHARHPGALVGGQIVGLSYLGGCFLPLLLYAPFLWSRRALLKAACMIAPCLLLPLWLKEFKPWLWQANGRLNWLLFAQSALFLTSGLHLFLLAASDFWKRREPSALLLFLWIAGVFVFTTGLYLFPNGRSLLPMLPAVGIVLARRFERRCQSKRPNQAAPKVCAAPELWLALPAAALSLLLVKADYDLAAVGRTAAKEVCAKYQAPSQTLWFEGHWGFQYYMEQQGAKALERDLALPKPGDRLVVPSEAVNAFDIPANLVRLVDTLDYVPNRHWTTMSLSAGAGFYAATAGPFPFSVGHISPERYYVFEFTQSLAAASRTPGGISRIGALALQFALERNGLSQ